jgi:hypothetical protein
VAAEEGGQGIPCAARTVGAHFNLLVEKGNIAWIIEYMFYFCQVEFKLATLLQKIEFVSLKPQSPLSNPSEKYFALLATKSPEWGLQDTFGHRHHHRQHYGNPHCHNQKDLSFFRFHKFLAHV